MRNIPLKTTLSALLVSLPLASAFAYDEYDAAAGVRIDPVSTSSVGAAVRDSYAKQLDVSLRAAETNLQAGGRDAAVDPAIAAGIRAELSAIKQAARQEGQANGGELSAASYRDLSERVRAIQQQPYYGVR
jgi:hypothetical protein